MPTTRRPLVAGNWKMFGLKRDLREVRKVLRTVAARRFDCDVVICPPATLLAEVRRMGRRGRVHWGGQTCHVAPSGPHTGDVSADMLADAGAHYVIVGHSERRTNHGETDEIVAKQFASALRAGLKPILCIGESKAENEAGQTQQVLERQIDGSLPKNMSLRDQQLTIAYEPVWAIGTGRTPTLDEIAQMHAVIRAALRKRLEGDGDRARVIYGGSVKPDNAGAISMVPGVDGALVGGASLTAQDFNAIIGCFCV